MKGAVRQQRQEKYGLVMMVCDFLSQDVFLCEAVLLELWSCTKKYAKPNWNFVLRNHGPEPMRTLMHRPFYGEIFS